MAWTSGNPPRMKGNPASSLNGKGLQCPSLGWNQHGIIPASNSRELRCFRLGIRQQGSIDVTSRLRSFTLRGRTYPFFPVFRNTFMPVELLPCRMFSALRLRWKNLARFTHPVALGTRWSLAKDASYLSRNPDQPSRHSLATLFHLPRSWRNIPISPIDPCGQLRDVPLAEN